MGEDKHPSKAIEIFEMISDIEGERDSLKRQNESLSIRIAELELIETEHNTLLKILGKLNLPKEDEPAKLLRSNKMFMMDGKGNLEKLG